MNARQTVTAYVALGANLGDPAGALSMALQHLSAASGIAALRASALYRSAPVAAAGPWYCNAVAEVQTTLTAPDLLQMLQALERTSGRARSYRNAPRTLDLDLLLYGSARIDSAALTVPHPRMWGRAFVLLPLQELAPELVSVAALARVADQRIARLHHGRCGWSSGGQPLA